ncbi:DUF1513 domain-containing protein [Vibrio sp. ZSDE26]|uniref:DUF1513 domain-containing protein n=1 Tax=Vibrio amylolyticus TaxID=2847292 RepID=A0A9X2BIH0_9VIBR|nr:DUF1513 domain-containing protein [Vibrio amylolyticus]MCK6264110.1 DUF1513 domain-containing protein [Vibrio amylolyticus]
MQPMVTDKARRSLLKAALFGAATPLLPFGCASTSKANEPSLIGCSIKGRDRFSAVVADSSGNPIRDIPLPSRGHGIAINSALHHGVAFSRRPGTYFVVFDYMTGEVISHSVAKQGRHYYGHGVYSNDGQWLFATEGDSRTSAGIIGVYDVKAGYQKVAEFTGFGLGPHEVTAMPDGSLAIGVGGVHTDGRIPMNLATMQPSLSYLNANGELIEQVGLEDQHLSIRHLAHDGDKTLLCGQQYRGDPDESPSLLAMHTSGGEMQSLLAEPEQWARFNHYIASIAATNHWILATSPRGNCYGIWSKETRQLVELESLPDASGVVAHQDTFYVSSGAGNVVTKSSQLQSHRARSGVQWDNHWSRI